MMQCRINSSDENKWHNTYWWACVSSRSGWSGWAWGSLWESNNRIQWMYRIKLTWRQDLSRRKTLTKSDNFKTWYEQSSIMLTKQNEPAHAPKNQIRKQRQLMNKKLKNKTYSRRKTNGRNRKQDHLRTKKTMHRLADIHNRRTILRLHKVMEHCKGILTISWESCWENTPYSKMAAILVFLCFHWNCPFWSRSFVHTVSQEKREDESHTRRKDLNKKKITQKSKPGVSNSIGTASIHFNTEDQDTAFSKKKRLI